jgi:hypothetical protein
MEKLDLYHFSRIAKVTCFGLCLMYSLSLVSLHFYSKNSFEDQGAKSVAIKCAVFFGLCTIASRIFEKLFINNINQGLKLTFPQFGHNL